MCAASASTSGEIASPSSPVPSGASRSRRFFARRLAAATGSAARADDLGAAVGVEYRRVETPVFADAVRFGVDHDRGASRGTQRRDAGVRACMRDCRERRFVRHDGVTRHTR